MKLFLVNGFLGSGKTTAIRQAAMTLQENEVKAGVITNDQGVQLVDSKFFQSFDMPTCEVTDGCFCCNYDQLDGKILSMSATDPLDVIFAESVGSCADLIATVVNPLLHFHPDMEVRLSVFTDAQILPVLLQGSSYFFDKEVHYIYQKQLEEAEILVVNKTDLIDQTQLEEVTGLIEDRYPDKKIFYQNSLQQTDIEVWLTALQQPPQPDEQKALDIDYDIYGAGEAKLGWLDGQVEIQTDSAKAWQAGYTLIDKIYTAICDEAWPIGHLKFFIDDGINRQKISFTMLNQDFSEQVLKDPQAKTISLLINARIQTEPDKLKRIVSDALTAMQEQEQSSIIKKELTAFQPGYPEPVHKMII